MSVTSALLQAQPVLARRTRHVLAFALRHRRPILFALHAALIPVVYAAAFALRFDGVVPTAYAAVFRRTIPLLVAIRLVVFAHQHQYNGWWRHVGLYDLTELVKAVTVSEIVFVAAVVVAQRTGVLTDPRLPYSIFILDWGVALTFFGMIRFGARWLRELAVTSPGRRTGKRALIVGAGNAADRLLRQIRLDPGSGILPVCLVDDSRDKQSLDLHGVRVRGTLQDIATLVRAHAIELIVVAIANATRDEMARIADHCASLPVELKIVPSLSELLDGSARLSQLRTVRIDDLLGRAPVNLDLTLVCSDMRDRVVAITGGAGSIGSELARQVAAYAPAKLLLIEQAESPLYFVHLELATRHPDLDVIPVMADVTDARAIREVFAEHHPDIVFHAAAFKHVPMMESDVLSAARNNIFGTAVVAECAVRAGVSKVVLISTDKAVNPSSVMGATKRAAERFVLESTLCRTSRTDFRVVRFGNVLGSNGSVIPVFKKQIEVGGPVTVTHADATRYFMTIPEAAQLVLQACALPEAARRISMLDMGEPVNVMQMAERLIRLSGFEPHAEIPIVITGLRAGEKLHEELTSSLFTPIPTAVEKICVLRRGASGNEDVLGAMVALRTALERRDRRGVVLVLKALVPEWTSPQLPPPIIAPLVDMPVTVADAAIASEWPGDGDASVMTTRMSISQTAEQPCIQ